jgi:dihydrodipicolinate reductase
LLPILATIEGADQSTLSAGASRAAARKSLEKVVSSLGVREWSTAPVADALDAVPPVDMLVEYTSAAAVEENVWTPVRTGHT